MYQKRQEVEHVGQAVFQVVTGENTNSLDPYPKTRLDPKRKVNYERFKDVFFYSRGST